jgi:Sec-independent protein translocase protein TatA
MARVRDDDRFRHVSPESIILPLPYQLVTLNTVTEGEIWLDWGFVEFWKANYCTWYSLFTDNSFITVLTSGFSFIFFWIDTVQRGVTADPDTIITGPGDTAELQLVIASLRDVVRKQADELGVAKSEITQLKQQQKQQQSQPQSQPQTPTVPPPPKANAAKNTGPAVEELKKKLADLQAEHEKEVGS